MLAYRLYHRHQQGVNSTYEQQEGTVVGTNVTSWPRVIVAILAAWMTLTVSLHIFLSQSNDDDDNAMTLTGMIQIPSSSSSSSSSLPYSRRQPPPNPLHRPKLKTAHEKLLAYAKAHPPTAQTNHRPPIKTMTTTTTMTSAVRRRRTAQEKLKDYAKASQNRRWSPESWEIETKINKNDHTNNQRNNVASVVSAANAVFWHSSPGKTLRDAYEDVYPPNDQERIRSFVHSLRTNEIDDGIRQTSHLVPFDPLDCPDTPPPGYPLEFPLVDILQEWPVDQLQWPIPSSTVMEDATTSTRNDNRPYLYHSLCMFDWDRPDHRERVRRYQLDFDVPMIVRHHPEFMQATERWMRSSSSIASSSSSSSNNNNNNGNEHSYLSALIGSEPQKTEHSFQSNHLPYWKPVKHMPANWRAPSENIQMTFAEWSQRADAMTDAITNHKDQSKLDHYYFRLDAKGDRLKSPPQFQKNPYLYDELRVFDPQKTKNKPGQENIFMMRPTEARGINCRFGMAGNVAEAHFDMSSNWITLLGGHRRYILSHPRECANLAMHPLGHPSARHSSVNWSDVRPIEENENSENNEETVNTKTAEARRALAQASATQVILQASDALYLPTNWLHFIVSLDRNYQCNARSGIRHGYDDDIRACGFGDIVDRH